MTQQLSAQQLQEIKAAFQKYDKDNSNSIDRHELKTLLESTLSANLSDKLLEKYVNVQFQKTDSNQNNVIEYDEFVKLYTTLYFSPELPISMRIINKPKQSYVQPSQPSPSIETQIPKKKPLSEEEKRKAKTCFDKYDLDKSGSIDRQELSKLLESVFNEQGKMSKLLFNRLVDIHFNTATQNDHISFEEFLNIYRNIFGEDSDSVGTPTSSGKVAGGVGLPGM